jgi:hypothetical protein
MKRIQASELNQRINYPEERQNRKDCDISEPESRSLASRNTQPRETPSAERLQANESPC